MSKSTHSRHSRFAYPFWIILAIAVLVYILRGVGILTFVPGGILLILMAGTLIFGIFYGIEKTRRF